MELTRLAIENTQPADKPIKLFDGHGLYLEIAPSGGRWWRFKYRFGGKEKRLSLGVYPSVGIKAAREKHEQVRKQLAAGIDPGAQRQLAKLTRTQSAGDTFETIAREWYAMHAVKWAATYKDKVIRRLEMNIFPWVGKCAIREITAPELLAAVRRIEERGTNETAHRTLQACGRVFRYAIATGRAERDISRDLLGALAPVIERHHAAITEPKAVGALLRAIDGYIGSVVTKCALRLAPLVFVRPGELRKAEWKEIDLEQREWRIPAERMKMRTTHIVPLSDQAIAILRELQPLTGHRQYVFPGELDWRRPMSDNTVTAALRRLGYASTEMTGHGFRSMASTLLHEQGWNSNVIERQLAHQERNAVKAAYNYAEYLPERRKMMQAWSDYLDTLREGAQVVAIRSVRVA